jgi:hypothetical protein
MHIETAEGTGGRRGLGPALLRAGEGRAKHRVQRFVGIRHPRRPPTEPPTTAVRGKRSSRCNASRK